MIPFIFAALALTLAIAGVTIIILGGRRARPGLIDSLERHTVVIHTNDEKSIRGVLMAARPDGFLLERADMLLSASEVAAIGAVVVPRASVSFIQRLAGDAS